MISEGGRHQIRSRELKVHMLGSDSQAGVPKDSEDIFGLQFPSYMFYMEAMPPCHRGLLWYMPNSQTWHRIRGLEARCNKLP